VSADLISLPLCQVRKSNQRCLATSLSSRRNFSVLVASSSESQFKSPTTPRFHSGSGSGSGSCCRGWPRAGAVFSAAVFLSFQCVFTRSFGSRVRCLALAGHAVCVLLSVYGVFRQWCVSACLPSWLFLLRDVKQLFFCRKRSQRNASKRITRGLRSRRSPASPGVGLAGTETDVSHPFRGQE